TVNPDLSQARSIFPDERDPALSLTAFQGDLGLGSGAPQSIYDLDTRQIALGELTVVGTRTLRPGQSWTLPDGSTVEFLGTRQWITVSIRHDPGEPLVLIGAGAVLVGLMVSLSGKRRRGWARITPAEGGGSLIALGGLARTEYPGFADEFAGVAAQAGGDPPANEPATVAAGQRGQ
ncbi:MAG: cytochrome c biogenesis protein ResB, partial [Sporichthyaceae bacterium]|nr:cytochrome c biogenesis protein ResB [Sporichthyaceae bacterium]